MSLATRRNWRRLRSIILWLAIPILIWVWSAQVSAAIRAIVSGLYFMFLLLAAPVWCAAPNRDGTFCRNNSSGLLLGCHLRQHRWQKAKAMMTPRRSKEVLGRLMRDPKTGAAIVSAAAAALSAIAAWVQLAVA